jgi:hypothetical protein
MIGQLLEILVACKNYLRNSLLKMQVSQLLDFESYMYIRVTDIPDSLLKLFN